MLVLADEAPVSAFRASAWIRSGKALRRIGHYGFALEQLERLAIEPENLAGLREKGTCLQRLALQGRRGSNWNGPQPLPDNPAGPSKGRRDLAPLGRVEKDAWTSIWRQPDASAAQRIEDARYEDALLRAAVSCYGTAFRSDPKHYYSGINALTLMHLQST